MKLWYFIRSLTLYILISITVLIWTPPLLLMIVTPIRVRFKWTQAWGITVRWLCKVICGIQCRTEGLEQVQLPAVFLCKHQSAYETMVLPSYVPYTCFIFKKELMYIPVFGWSIWAANHIAINRGQAVKAFKEVVKQGKERINQHLSIGIFPEGTRTPVGEHPPFQKSGAAVAKMAGAHVIPVAVNSGKVWPRNSFIKYPGIVTISFGPAITTHDKSVDEINDAAYAWVKQAMESLEN